LLFVFALFCCLFFCFCSFFCFLLFLFLTRVINVCNVIKRFNKNFWKKFFGESRIEVTRDSSNPSIVFQVFFSRSKVIMEKTVFKRFKTTILSIKKPKNRQDKKKPSKRVSLQDE